MLRRIQARSLPSIGVEHVPVTSIVEKGTRKLKVGEVRLECEFGATVALKSMSLVKQVMGIDFILALLQVESR